MQLKEFNILLDIKKYKKIEYIEVVKNDAGTNVFNIQLLNGLNNYDLTGLKTEIVFSKSDGTTVLQDEENGVSIINNTEGKIQCALKTNTIASSGKVMAEVRVLSVIDSRLLTSTRFEFFVRDSIVNDETIISTNEFPILNQLIATTEGLIQQVGLIEAQVPAQVVTDLNAVSLLANQLSLDLVAHKAENAFQFNDLINNKKTLLLLRQTNLVGDQIVTLGFRPKTVSLQISLLNLPKYKSLGAYDGMSQCCLFDFGNGVNSSVSDTHIAMLHSGDNLHQASITYTDTGFVLAWVGVGLPDVTMHMLVLASQ